jgi:hypothetical protein
MGSFSDAFKKAIDKPIGLTTKPGFTDRAKSGKLSGFGDFMTFGLGTPTREQATMRGRLFTEGNPLKAGEGAIRTDVKTAALSGNVGALAIRSAFNQDDGPTPPPVTGGPGVGAGTQTAVQAARRRAIAENVARRRRSGTTATSPLGVIGAGATTGKKRLTGE